MHRTSTSPAETVTLSDTIDNPRDTKDNPRDTKDNPRDTKDNPRDTNAGASGTQPAVTIITRCDGRWAGKTIDRHGAKKTVLQTGDYAAQTHRLAGHSPAEHLTALGALIGNLRGHQGVIAGTAPAMPACYRLLAQKQLPHGGIGPTETVHGPTTAKLKANFAPSGLALLDYDPKPEMPPEWLAWTPEERWTRIAGALPELAGAARLILPSSGGRVIAPDGRPLTSGQHVWVRIPNEMDNGDLDRWRLSIRLRLFEAGLVYTHTDQDGATKHALLLDVSVLQSSRSIFAGPPRAAHPYRVATYRPEVVDGVTVTPDLTLSAPARATFSRVTGQRIGRSLCIEDGQRLTLATVLETERGPLSVEDYLASGHGKLRCQAPFRDSTSFAAFITRLPNGEPLVHDAGTSTNYRLALDADDVELTGKLDEDLAAVASAPAPAKTAVARAALAKHAWRVPWQLPLADAIAQTLAKCPEADPEDLRTQLEWRLGQRNARARAQTEAGQCPGVAFVRVPDIAAAHAAIERAGTGVFVIRASHGTGKTQHLLRPLAAQQRWKSIVGIAPRVSLARTLANQLHLDSYQSAAARDSLHLSTCINSIGRTDFPALADPDLVMVDECARVLREMHNPAGTMAKTGQRLFARLIALLDGAELALLADADVSDLDLKTLVDQLARPVTVLLVDDPPAAGLTFQMGADSATMAELDAALARGERCYVASDSARLIAGLTARIAARYPERKVFGLHARDETATTHTLIGEWLADDFDTAARRYDVLLTSPVMESGVSLEHEHFARHFAFYSGTAEPTAMLQMLRRDRTARHWSIGIRGAGVKTLPVDFHGALNSLAAAQRRTAVAENGTITIEPASDYDRAVCRYLASANAARGAYAASLHSLLLLRGWRDAAWAPPDDDGKAELGAAVAASDQEAADAVLAAPDVDTARASRLETAQTLTPAEAAQLARYRVRATHALPDDPLAPEDVERWQAGRLAAQNLRFDQATGLDWAAAQIDRNDRESAVPLVARSFRQATGAALRRLLTDLDIDIEQGSGTVTAAAVARVRDSMRGTDDALILTRARIADFAAPVAQPIRWLGAVLGRLGVGLIATDRDPAEGRRYALDEDAQRTKSGRLVCPGLLFMKECQARRLGIAHTQARNSRKFYDGDAGTTVDTARYEDTRECCQ